MIKVVETINKKWTVNMEEVDPENFPHILNIRVHGHLFDNNTYDVSVSVKEDGWIKESKRFTHGKRQINNYLKIFGVSL